MHRRSFISLMAGGAAAMSLDRHAHAAPQRPNILLITADDLNWDSVGANGCALKTPNLDKLASEGLRFEHAHTPEAVCQPSRQMLLTGLYPNQYGAVGFNPFDDGVPTLSEALADAGYLNGILGKVGHYGKPKKHRWTLNRDMDELGHGRDPALYARFAAEFFGQAKKEGKPFFLVANSHDPHRPFSGSADEKRRFAEGLPTPTHAYAPMDVPVPGFLPDISDVRKEIAEYFSSVHRLDATVGAILKALGDANQAENTIVFFLSDHGMPLPFAKTNCYRHSTRSPWMVRWPGVVKPGSVDREHLLSNVDFAPTILDALGLKPLPKTAGRSFLPVLKGEEQAGRESVYTLFNQTSGKNDYPMRALQTRRFGYIFNPWSDGKTAFKNESMSGLSMKAMREAAANDQEIAARVELFLHRVPEELYDYEADPDAKRNLIAEPQHAGVLKDLRAQLLAKLVEIEDPQAKALRERMG